MTGQEVWSLIAPLIPIPHDVNSEAFQTISEAYVITFGALQLYDNWVARGKPQEWREDIKKCKKRNVRNAEAAT